MQKTNISLQTEEFSLIRVNTLIIGSGAAGLNAAIQLYEKGVEDIAILTEKWGGGTSNNAGSDKQTYYRLAPDNREGDSAIAMAETLYSGGCMHGDIAMIEAAYSLQAFHHLVSAGVPFPHDAYGRYPGYLTDHDRKGRGTSAGPRTSRYMFQSLAKKIVDYQIPIIDNHQLIQLLYTDNDTTRQVCGALAWNADNNHNDISPYVVFQANSLILATGGPGELYQASVYPKNQSGATGYALAIGAKAQNLTEFQYGIASIKFRWNLSGSYQQVVPRYFSVDKDGIEYDFLNEVFDTPKSLSKAIFLKGYQWPFDPGKLKNQGSSLIDLMVYREKKVHGRRVFIDYKKNPILTTGLELDFHSSDSIALDYNKQCDALGDKPIDRLLKMNRPAVDLYRKNGIDLTSESIEIDVCAQHCNGGLTGSIWWESNVKHLFSVGEANGSHGVYRPGGSALNSGQVGGFRAAALISQETAKPIFKQSAFLDIIEIQLENTFGRIFKWMSEGVVCDLNEEFRLIKERMSQYGGILRSGLGCEIALSEIQEQKRRLKKLGGVQKQNLALVFQLEEQLLMQEAVFESIAHYINKDGASRGSYLIESKSGTELETLPYGFEIRYEMDKDDGFTRKHQLCVKWDGNEFIKEWVPLNPIPSDELWFETTWKEFRDKKIIKR